MSNPSDGGPRLVVGLGNPGSRYARTRHNGGFLLVDRIRERLAGDDWRDFRSDGAFCRSSSGGRPLFMAKPSTYMNESGRFVQAFASFYKIAASDILVCVDDFALPLGRIRIRPSGSAGGQKGLASILQRFGTDAIARLRFGIGPVPAGWDPADFVLSKFAKEESELLDETLDRAVEAVEVFLAEGTDRAMNLFNGGAS